MLRGRSGKDETSAIEPRNPLLLHPYCPTRFVFIHFCAAFPDLAVESKPNDSLFVDPIVI